MNFSASVIVGINLLSKFLLSAFIHPVDMSL